MIRQKSRWDAVLITFLCLMALIMVIPFWQIIVITFSQPRDYLLHPTHLWIYHLDTSVMTGILKTQSIHRGLFVSLFVVIVGWMVSMLLTVAGGYDIVILFRIIIPVCKPVLLTVSMFYIVGYWNDYFSAMMYVDSSELYPLSLILRNVIISRTTAISSLAGTAASSPTEQYSMALILVSMLPIIVLYPWIQRYFTTGIMVGALKE